MIKKNYNLSRILLILVLFFLILLITDFLCSYFMLGNIALSPLFFHDTNDWFMDFFKLNYMSCFPYKEGVVSWNSPPFQALFSYIFIFLGGGVSFYKKNDLNFIRASWQGIFSVCCFFFIAILLLSLVLFLLLRNKVSKFDIFLLCCLFFESSPFMFELCRANYVIYSLLFLLYFLYFKNHVGVKREISYLFLAIASALKFYPFIFSLILIKEKDFRGFIKTIIYILILMFLPFCFLPGKFSNVMPCFKNIFQYMVSYKPTGLVENVANDLSLKSFLSIIYLIFTHKNIDIIQNLLSFKIFNLIFLVLFVSLLFYSFYKNTNKTKDIILLSISLVLLPSPSFFYVAIYLVVPIAFSILNLNQDKMNIKNNIIFYCLLFCLMPIFLGFINEEYEYNLRWQISVFHIIIQLLLIFIFLFIVILQARKENGKKKIK